MIYTFDLINDVSIKTINEFYEFCDFIDGSTSGSKDKESKYNEELFDTCHSESLISFVDKEIKRCNEFSYILLPRATTNPRFLRYTKGMHYAYHNDFYMINEIRTDYSVTCFLNSPDEYEGGELVLRIGDKEVEYKMEPGKAIAYPTGTLHKVNKVTSGERRVIVFWLESIISDSRIRDTLSEYSSTLMKYKPHIEDLIGEFEKTRYRLIREYAQF